MKCKENETVRIIKDFKDNVKKNDVGVVLMAFEKPREAYEVEVLNENGESKAQCTLLPNDLELFMTSKENCERKKIVEIDLENFPCEKLIEIVEKGLDIELIEDAMQKLSDIDENYALAKGIAFLKNDSFDPYFQACIFDFVYDLDKEAVLDCVLSRNLDIDSYFFKDILRTMTVHTSYEDFVKMKNHKNVLDFLLTQYEKYDDNAKDEMIDLVKEFNENFHTNTFFKELT